MCYSNFFVVVRFALRSYLYLLVHAVPAWLYAKVLQPNPMLVFYTLRCLLGCLSATCEVRSPAVFLLCFLLFNGFSAGMKTLYWYRY
jgi:hypothetical protein